MSFQPGGYQQQVLYQAETNSIQNLKSIRNHLHKICSQHANQYVRIETLDGQVYMGRIVNCDRGLMYLAVRKQGGHRAFFGSPNYNDDELILTLVLYELLVITLLYT
ncbi:hypothetical protein J7E73_08655 [Paenibacillus albidus]|uniref:hypothetical protein n=1 Tax=Paenibacillus albidus TaxID=2041023 RepID=UPI001BEB3883|nr:hypothetical protein [Paenibacillus albidus]MBT2289201.1 hypothetical protein [Paenibacillus albidus]